MNGDLMNTYLRTCVLFVAMASLVFAEQVKNSKSSSSSESQVKSNTESSSSAITIQAEVSDLSSTEAEQGSNTASGQITIEINGKKHTFPLDVNDLDLKSSLERVIKDGEASIAVIGGALADKGIEAGNMKKIVQESIDAIDLPDDLPKQAKDQLKKMLESLPDQAMFKESITDSFGAFPSIQVEDFSIEKMEDLPAGMQKRIQMILGGESGNKDADLPVKANVQVRVFNMVDGKMVPVTQDKGDANDTKPKGPQTDATGLEALNKKMNEILSRLDSLEQELEALKAKK